MGYKYNFKTFNFDAKAFMIDYRLGVKKLMIGAGRAFALSAGRLVAVDTGMAKSALLGKVSTFEGDIQTAEEYMGLHDSSSSIDVTSQIKRTRKDYTEDWFGRYRRTPAAGRWRGIYSFWQDGKTLRFQFDPNVLQYNVWDKEWRSIDRGRAEFHTYVMLWRSRLLPKINDKKYWQRKSA